MVDVTNTLAQRQLARVRAAIELSPKNLHQLAAELHICRDRARIYIKHLHENGECYIAGWSRTASLTHKPVASYRLGVRRDAPKLARESENVRQRRRRAKIQADPDLRERYNQRQRAARFHPTLDPVTAALFGRAP